MILGIGTDLIRMDRLEKLSADPNRLCRLFTPAELDYARKRRDFLETLAGMFAAKEAMGKALGCGVIGIGFLDFEVCHTPEGGPVARLHGRALERMQVLDGKMMHLSIAHDGGFAQAVAILEGEEQGRIVTEEG